ncbi:MAG: magnesium-translocating P-type ATPase [bacterium]
MQGLSSIEATKKQKQFGKNEFVQREHQSAVQSFFVEFKSPLNLVLLAAAAISFFTGATTEAILIFCIIVASSSLDFIISYKSQKAAELLAKRVLSQTRVYRDGVSVVLPITEIVVGDIVVLAAGDVIPADGKLISSSSLYVNESSLTGESVPVQKNSIDLVFMGSGVVSGSAEVEIVAIGQDTKFGDTVHLLSNKEQKNSFEKGIQQFSMLITKIAILLCVVLFVVNAVLKHSVADSVLFSLALAVGIVPELLPMIVAVNLSRASIRMSKKGVIVKKLSAIENFGSMDVLCTDKTGTLTEDNIAVVEYVDMHNNSSDEVLRLAYINSALHTATKTPLDDAIIEKESFDIQKYSLITQLPFDFDRKRDSLVVQSEGVIECITKGAPEAVFSVCTMSDADKDTAQKLFIDLSTQGYRVLAIATKIYAGPQTEYSTDDEINLTFVGFVAFIDPAKKDVSHVLEEMKRRSVDVKIISGDNHLVVEKIARDVGLISLGTLLGTDIEDMSDADLAIAIEKTTLFCRVNPEQKNRIIIALQKNGHVVGYMGDGINDAPALRTADIGISVENAVDVAKESADIVLVQKSLSQLIGGVVEGRSTFVNTMKYIKMAMSSNFGNMLSMTTASIVLPFLPMLPTQILLNNLLYEVTQVPITLDRVDTEVLFTPTQWDIKKLKHFMIVFGLASSIFDFITFFVLYKVFHLYGGGFQTGWFLESFLTQTIVIFFIRSEKSIFKASRPHKALIYTSFSIIVLAWAIALSHIGGLFGFAPLPKVVLLTIVAISLGYFVLVECIKKIQSSAILSK